MLETSLSPDLPSNFLCNFLPDLSSAEGFSRRSAFSRDCLPPQSAGAKACEQIPTSGHNFLLISGKEVGFVLEKKRKDLFIALGRLNLES